MATSKKPDFVVDYLVVGAGFSGLSFTDELLTRTSASILIVDKRDRPGGHWVDSYPFVKLHQPSTQFGVESRGFEHIRIDEHGLNRGLLALASGQEIQAYCISLMRDRFLNSGRVTFLFSTEYKDGKLRQAPSGKTLTVQVKKKLVDATFYENTIPLKHTRSFAVEGVTCIPPNHLPELCSSFSHFTVIGAGKTGMDSLIWLLESGVDPARIRWVIASDYWYFNRAKAQGRLEFLADTLENNIANNEALVVFNKDQDPSRYALAMEHAGSWMRLDSSIYPKLWHGASLTSREMDELRRITDVVRKGYVTKIEPQRMICQQGVVAAKPQTLYVDCSASGLPDKLPVPVFQKDKIVLQMIRWAQIPYSAAKIAFLESLSAMQDEERNYYSVPIRYQKTVLGYVQDQPQDIENRAREKRHPELKKWVAHSRLDCYTKLLTEVKSEDRAILDALRRLRDSTKTTYQHLQRPRASL